MYSFSRMALMLLALSTSCPRPVEASMYNPRVVTDAWPDYRDLDGSSYEPFGLRMALSDETEPGQGEAPKVLSASGRPVSADLARANAARAEADPVVEPPTLHSLGFYWVIAGDENGNAQVAVECRRAGGEQWRHGAPLFRVERGAERNDKGQSSVGVPGDSRLYAGSLLMLEPGTRYEVRLSLTDPDGGGTVRELSATTAAEPLEPTGMRVRHVVPGNGGGTGSAEDPFLGLAEAQSVAQPGDLFLVRSGAYPATFTVDRSGEPGKPIIWRGEGEVTIDGQEGRGDRPERIVSAGGVHDVWFEHFTLRNGDYGIVAHNSSRIVVRRCHVYGVEYGLTCTNNSSGAVEGFLISDNVIEGPSSWPRTKGIEEARGIQVTGAGHDVCYNRIRGFADAINCFGSQRCVAIDFHHNDISQMTDDGIEMDYSERNARCFENRLTDVFQGISVQPIYGGPVYIFRNALYNVAMETFKMHNSPSGAIVAHNTSVKAGMPLLLMVGEPVRNCVLRNNLFVGTQGNYAYETTAPMVDCDFDYDGFAGGPWQLFLKWNGQRYADIAEVRKSAPVYRHAVQLDAETLFASGTMPPQATEAVTATPPDLRLRADTGAIDAGEALAGLNDGFAGQAPDLGAYEFGSEVPHYGPR